MTNREKLNKMCISDILRSINHVTDTCVVLMLEYAISNGKTYGKDPGCQGNCDECIQKWLNTKRD